MLGSQRRQQQPRVVCSWRTACCAKAGSSEHSSSFPSAEPPRHSDSPHERNEKKTRHCFNMKFKLVPEFKGRILSKGRPALPCHSSALACTGRSRNDLLKPRATEREHTVTTVICCSGSSAQECEARKSVKLSETKPSVSTEDAVIYQETETDQQQAERWPVAK